MRASDPKRDIPLAVIGSIVIGIIIYIALQVVFLAALPHYAIGETWAKGAYTLFTGPFAEIATAVSLGWLATILYFDADHLPGGNGADLHHGTSRVSYGLSRNGYVRTVFERLNTGRVPWFGLLTAFIVGCVCFLPFPCWQLARRTHHQRLRADVRGCTAVVRRLPQAPARPNRVQAPPRWRGCSRRWRSSWPT